MKATIPVNNRQEGESIKAALEDPVVRAFTVIVGVLKGLPNDRSRQRVMDFVRSHNEDQGPNASS